MSNKPNLFKFATSELSQDAFICWLLAWADPSLKDLDPHLHQTGVMLVMSLLALNEQKLIPTSIESVEIKQQSSKIDILCTVNNKYILLIEDKTNTKNHSDQLAKYYKKQKEKYEDELIHPIYFKTGDQSSYRDVERNGYKVFTRAKFIEVLDYGAELGVQSDIFHNYRSYLKGIERKINSYKVVPLKEWGKWFEWIGFYKELQIHLKEGGWDYIPQKNGGFLGFWWKWHKGTHEGIEFDYYLQLERKKFCFKIRPVKPIDKTKAAKIRDFYRSNLMLKAKAMGVDLKKNGRIGATMTVAALKGEYIAKNEVGLLDIPKTVANLQQMEAVIAQLSTKLSSLTYTQ